MYKIFGIGSGGYHTLALLIHFVNSLLVVYVVKRMANNRIIAWTTGLLYATAILVQMMPLFWAVGIAELGATFFFLSSLALFLNQRFKLSAVAFLLAVLTKESVLFLPGILVVYLLLQNRERKVASIESMKNLGSKLWPYIIVLIVYAILREQAVSPFTLPADAPYKVNLIGWHLVLNAYFYMWSVVPIIFPPLNSLMFHWGSITWFLVTLMIVIVLIYVVIRLRRTERNIVEKAVKSSYIWLTWFILAVVPLLFYPNHKYTYYLALALPPLIVMFLLALRRTALYFWRKERYVALICAALILISIISSSYYFYLNHAAGVGASGLIPRANLVAITKDGLSRLHPTLPKHAVLILDSEVVESVVVNYGPQVWYRDETISVFKREYLHIGNEGAYVATQGPESPDKVYLDPGRTFVFNISNGTLVEENLDNLSYTDK